MKKLFIPRLSEWRRNNWENSVRLEEVFGMEIMTYRDFENLLNGPAGVYYQGRWAYYEKVIRIIEEQKEINRVIELGPSFIPIVKDCDIMVRPETDSWGKPQHRDSGEYIHDATITPWPVKDKEYDLFIALQVWEHLAGKQKEAFAEVIRISKMAILSFPYMWDCPKDNANYPEHHMVDENIISRWTLGISPEKVIRIPRTGERVSKGPRIIYFWKFK